jgi:hypothetical protein
MQFGLNPDMIHDLPANAFSPSSSTQGDLTKKWIIADGKRCLVKGNHGGNSQESLNEIVATLLHQKQGRVPYVSYSTIRMGDNHQIYCVCESFTSDAVELIPVADLQKRGAVILYRRDSGAFVLHRIIRVKPEYYICCGDNEAKKEIVNPTQVVAVMDAFFRRDKRREADHFGYCIYKTLWVWLFPLRKSYIWVRRRLGRLLRRCRPGRK